MGAAPVAGTGGAESAGAFLAKPSRRIAWATVLGLAALAAAIRTIIWQRTAALMNDGPTFIALAEQFSSGSWREAIAHKHHPLYPLAIAWAQPLFSDFERAAVAVSIASGALAVVFLHDFLARAFDRRVAVVGALLLAVHPYAAPYSADVQSDGLYIALFLGAVAATWRLIERPAFAPAAAAGCLAGLAYLTRPEGIGMAVVGVLTLLGLWLRGARPARAVAAGCAGLVLGAALLAVPYVTVMERETGELRLTRKKSAAAIVTLDGTGRERRQRRAAEAAAKPVSAPSRVRVAADAAGEVLQNAKRAFRLDHFLIGGLGLLAAGGPAGLRAAYAAGIAGFYALVLLGLHMSAGYVSMRHVLPPLLPLLAYVALGVPVLGRVLLFVPSRLARLGAPSARAAWLAGLLLLASASTLMAVRPQRAERAASRAAAEWLAARGGAERVAAAKERDAYYARAEHAGLPRPKGRSGRGWIEILQARGARYAVIDAEDATRYPGLQAEPPDPRIRVLHRAEAGGRAALVIEIAEAAEAE